LEKNNLKRRSLIAGKHLWKLQIRQNFQNFAKLSNIPQSKRIFVFLESSSLSQVSRFRSATTFCGARLVEGKKTEWNFLI